MSARHRRVVERPVTWRRMVLVGAGGSAVLALGVLALVVGTGQAAAPQARPASSSPPVVLSQSGAASPSGMVPQPGASTPDMLSQSGPAGSTDGTDGPNQAPSPARTTPPHPTASPTPSATFTCGFEMNGECYGGWWIGTP